MQKIIKICEICREKEKLTKSIDDPKPKSLFKEVRIPAGKNVSALRIDLCPMHHEELMHTVQRWVEKTPPLDEFVDPDKDEDKPKEETEKEA